MKLTVTARTEENLPGTGRAAQETRLTAHLTLARGEVLRLPAGGGRVTVTGGLGWLTNGDQGDTLLCSGDSAAWDGTGVAVIGPLGDAPLALEMAGAAGVEALWQLQRKQVANRHKTPNAWIGWLPKLGSRRPTDASTSRSTPC